MNTAVVSMTHVSGIKSESLGESWILGFEVVKSFKHTVAKYFKRSFLYAFYTVLSAPVE